jgi:hypothetical protein
VSIFLDFTRLLSDIFRHAQIIFIFLLTVLFCLTEYGADETEAQPYSVLCASARAAERAIAGGSVSTILQRVRHCSAESRSFF